MRNTSALGLALLGLTSLLSSAIAASAGCGKAATLTSGVKTLTAKGKQRQYAVQVPPNYDPARPYRVVFGWHGAWDSMDTTVQGTLAPPVGTFRYFGLGNIQAANESTILVGPDALNKAWYNRNDEDLAFFDAMLQQLSDGLCVDEKRVFSLGFSHGGAFSKMLSCLRTSVLRGVVILDGGGPIDGATTCSTDPISALIQHGVDDGIESGRATRDQFVQRNGCNPNPTPKEPAKGSGAAHIVTKYQGCKDGFAVWFNAFDGQHWQAPFDGGSGNNGQKTFTGTEAWKFISQFE